MRVRLFISTIGVTALGFTALWPTAAGAAATPWVSCSFSGIAHMTTPMTMTTRHIRFTSVVHFSQCASSARGVTRGTGYTTGAFDGSCATAAGTAVQRIEWANGRTSIVHATFVNAGPEVVRESVTNGLFNGASGGNVNAVVGPPSVLIRCGGSGVTTADFVGRIVMSG